MKDNSSIRTIKINDSIQNILAEIKSEIIIHGNFEKIQTIIPRMKKIKK